MSYKLIGIAPTAPPTQRGDSAIPCSCLAKPMSPIANTSLPAIKLRPLFICASVAFAALFAFYVQTLQAAVEHGKHLQLQSCEKAGPMAVMPSACRR